jgi:hypothetical protein
MVSRCSVVTVLLRLFDGLVQVDHGKKGGDVNR